MALTRLRLQDFRNLDRQDLQVPPEGFALIGDNAQGKSNLLEAVYYLETFRSFRGAADRELVAFGETVFRVQADLGREGGEGEVRSVSAAYDRSSRRKKVMVDSREVSRIGDGLGRLGAVIFSPEDVALISEGPGGRRRFLDILLSLNDPGYLEHLQRFRHALQARNALLKQGPGGGDLVAWDELLTRHGAEVLSRRMRWAIQYAPLFRGHYGAVSGGEEAWMEYRCTAGPNPSAPRAEDGNAPSPSAPPVQELTRRFREALDAAWERDRQRGWTTVGPHRDDLYMGMGEPGETTSLRSFGSGGQRRTAALALRLVEGECLRRSRDRRPMILMDDVFAELDEGRSQRLLELLEGPGLGQALITAPKDSEIRLRRDTLPRWRIRYGRVES